MKVEAIQKDTRQEEVQRRSQQIADLRKLVDFLEQSPEVPISSHLIGPKVWFWAFAPGNYKENFLAAARAFGNCDKSVDGNDFLVIKDFGSVKLTLSIPRTDICVARTVKKEVEVTEWDCPSILSPEDIQQIGQEASAF